MGGLLALFLLLLEGHTATLPFNDDVFKADNCCAVLNYFDLSNIIKPAYQDLVPCERLRKELRDKMRYVFRMEIEALELADDQEVHLGFVHGSVCTREHFLIECVSGLARVEITPQFLRKHQHYPDKIESILNDLRMKDDLFSKALTIILLCEQANIAPMDEEMAAYEGRSMTLKGRGSTKYKLGDLRHIFDI